MRCYERSDKLLKSLHRMGGRVVEGTGLENRRGFTPTVGSNPTPSASSQDRDHDGIPNRYDRFDNRMARDRDGDGVPERFDRNDRNPYRQ